MSRPVDDTVVAEHLARPGLVFPPPPVFGPERRANAERVLAGRFRLIGEEYDLSDAPSWTVNPSRDKEWQIAQHKHYFAPDLLDAYRRTGDGRYLDRWAELMGSWLDEMGTGFISQSDAQVEAKRLESWVHALGQLRSIDWRGRVPDGLVGRLATRMGDEARYVVDHLKPVRNHRTFQLSSVFLVGALLPFLPGADELRDTGRRLLTENLLTDFHPDGVHIEMSTHYHQLVTETATAFLEVSLGNGIPVDRDLLERVHRALEFCAWFRWPDGDMPLLGDSDTGDLSDVLIRGARLFDDPTLAWAGSGGVEGRPPEALSRHFPVAGYVVLRDGWGDGAQHVVYDQALIGEGSHSHYDLFSLTYHAGGRPVLIDPGRFTYSSDPDVDGIDWRHYFKSTSAHNTVTIDGLDQTRYLSRTKHGPEVELVDGEIALSTQFDHIRGRARSHEYAPEHERCLTFLRRRVLVIVDRIHMVDGAEHRAEGRWHFAADLDPVLRAQEGHARVTAAGCTLVVVAAGAEIELVDGWASREYGVKEPAKVLSVGVQGGGTVEIVTVIAPPGVSVGDVATTDSGVDLTADGVRERVEVRRD